ncbi:hypothetical protein R3P38DRAFT_3283571 [Favolaschia claudopus]|uniref:F-box domain-containing protein n=1 Tax=Favolaschia claudopus TaxID=2862362 RepID=A0AAW0A784_9AGAR
MEIQPPESYLRRIPTEVWHLCWNSCSFKELKRLSLVCRVFAAICHPLLFRDQRVRVPDVDRKNWIQMTYRIQSTIQRLLRLAGSPHAVSVRSWHWQGDSEYSGLKQITERFPQVKNISVVKERWIRLEEVFATTLGAYQGLTKLNISSWPIDTEFRATMASLPLLEDLSLLDCTMVVRTGPLLNLRHLSLHIGLGGLRAQSRGHALPALELATPETLHTLFVDDSEDGRSVIAHLAHSMLRCLTHLYITRPSTDAARENLIECLGNTPCLELIALYPTAIIDPSPTAPRLASPQTAFPSLMSFNGPISLVHFFTRDRPVTEIILDAGDFQERRDLDDRAIISHLQMLSTTAPLRKLVLNPEISPENMPKLCEVIRFSFSELRALFLTPREPRRPPSPSLDDDDDFSDESSVGDEIDDRATQTLIGSDVSGEGEMSNKGPGRVRISPSPPPAPAIELPGHMYRSSAVNKAFPPIFKVKKQAESLSAIAQTLDLIYKGVILLPPLVGELHLNSSDGIYKSFSTAEQHRAILELEKRLPCLRTVTFGPSDWSLRGAEWTTRSTRMISYVWQANGTRIERRKGEEKSARGRTT